MLLIFAGEFVDETKKALTALFNEDLGIKDRIDNSKRFLNDIMKKINQRDSTNSHSYMDLRFLSVLLSSRFPEKYYPYKNTEYKYFTQFIDDQFNDVIKGTSNSPGTQYEIYNRYADAICDRIRKIPEIQKIHSKLTQNTSFKDPAYKWMTQDVIYTGARQDISQPPKDIQEIIKLIAKKQQVILYGPPGTGKTYKAKHLSTEIVGGGILS